MMRHLAGAFLLLFLFFAAVSAQSPPHSPHVVMTTHLIDCYAVSNDNQATV
jgi:hypothetical protein